MLKKRGQIWIETVIYTLIGLTIIAILLSMVVPKIDQMRDKSLMVQAITNLNHVDGLISEIMVTPGNSRQIDLSFNKGTYVFDALNGGIYYNLSDTKLFYSQLNQVVHQGEVDILTTSVGDKYFISAYLNYSSLNLTYNSQNIPKTLSANPTGYKLVIENKGTTLGKTNINIRSI